MKTLDKFTPNETGKVVEIQAQGPVKRRLFDMGITPGVEITMKKTAPLGDPIELHLRGYELSLRKSEACLILMDSQKGGQ